MPTSTVDGAIGSPCQAVGAAELVHLLAGQHLPPPPDAAASVRTRPTALTITCVTRPPKTSVMPSASTMGAAVGTGSSRGSDGAAAAGFDPPGPRSAGLIDRSCRPP